MPEHRHARPSADRTPSTGRINPERKESSRARVRQSLLWGELAAIFVGVPLLIWSDWFPVGLILGPLYLITLYAIFWQRRWGELTARHLWYGNSAEAERAGLRRVLWRFALLAPAIGLFTATVFPDRLFDLPSQQPLLWVTLLVFYPLLSVYPQEMLYRAFFFRRYAPLFPRQGWLLASNALLFGFMHIVFGNGVATALSTIGGYLFADTYARSRSLRLVCLEHTLYGNLLFSVGLGKFFLYGHAAVLMGN